MAYVYRHIRLDKNEPFYVGIGLTPYRYKSKQGRNKIWKRIVSKTSYDVEILLDDLTWEDACKKEIEFIKLYGRIDKGTGILANLTDGGDGNLGLQHSEEALKRISESSKNRVGHWRGKKLPEQTRIKIGQSKIGNTYTKGKNISEAHKESVRRHATGNKYCLGKKLSEETKKKIGDANRGRKHKEPWKCALKGERNGMFGKKHSESARKKMSQAQVIKPVLKKSLSGDILAEYSSITEAAAANGIFASGISACCRKDKKFPSYKGFLWEYVNKKPLFRRF